MAGASMERSLNHITPTGGEAPAGPVAGLHPDPEQTDDTIFPFRGSVINPQEEPYGSLVAPQSIIERNSSLIIYFFS